MIVTSTKNRLTAALVLTLSLVSAPALADTLPTVPAIGTAAAAGAPAALLLVTLDTDGFEQTAPTQAGTARALLAERGVTLGAADYLSVPADGRLVDGTTVVYRRAVPIVLKVGRSSRTYRSAAGSVGDFLSATGHTPRPGERAVPALATPLGSGDVVRIERSWTSHVAEAIAPRTTIRYTSRLPRGSTTVLHGGASGMRIATFRTTELPGTANETTQVSSRIARPARPQVLLRGTGGPLAAAGRFALGGIAGAERIAGAAIHVLATAYTASCYGCSGITASGAHAGHGIIAVDPNVIPLGTHLFIPGYGRAVAGDTGGAIVGHRIDVGFDGAHEALNFGARAMTIYIVK